MRDLGGRLVFILIVILQSAVVLPYRCNDGSQIDDENVCDFRADCPDGVDESTCPSSCSFENGLCNWYHEADQAVATFNWTLWSNDAPGWYAGPSADHTLNSVSGHYLYVDDTLTVEGDKAILRSPDFSMAARGCTFSFWYFVYGEDFGTLKVLQYTPADDREYNLLTVIDRTGNKDTEGRWNFYQVEVQACAQNFRMSIQAEDTKTNAASGGYAIDDLKFEGCAYILPLAPGGSCQPSEGLCDSGHCYPYSENCDFTMNCCDGTDESFSNCVEYKMCDFEADMCDWEQLTDDMFDWTRQNKGTDTGSTGPSKDHTTRTGNGYYVYTEVNSAQPGDNYRLGSYYIEPTSSGCDIRFYYHMRGNGIGALNVYTRTQVNGQLTLLWTNETAHGNFWAYESLPLISNEPFQVVFEGVRGTTNQGDIALDDISFTPQCREYGGALPSAVTPTPVNNCPQGQRPCNVDQCVPESYYCDFNQDCSPAQEDEKYCPAFCNFDSTVSEPFCYWSQDVNDDFDWSYYDMGTAPSGFKGPGTDHTSGTNQGHYIYVDGSTSLIDTFARLISPYYKKSKRGCKFNMWYYMFGVEYGDLEVRVRTKAGADFRIVKVSDSLLDYNKWILSSTEIPTCTTDFQIVIETEDRQPIPSESGFAVDDISFSDCFYPRPVDPGACRANENQCDSLECYPAVQQCDFTPDCCDLSDESPQTCNNLGYSMCDFETDFCFWTQMTSDEFDWSRYRGTTSTETSGPDVDHTTGTANGWYIYTEASNPKRYGDRAKLNSFNIEAPPGASTCTMRFYYHMYGKGIGTLNIYTRTEINGPMTQLWTENGQHGNIWIYDEIDIRSNKDFQIVIEGLIGTTVEGDIALDDISLTPDCVQTSNNLPEIITPPPSQMPCTTGYLPCSMGCIEADKYCDFRHDCIPGEEDEIQCPVYCSFEEEGDPLCGWTQDQNDDVDWEWYDNDEDPSFAGPEDDHTTGAKNGHYIYVDGSISQLDQRAKLISPMYKKAGRRCMFSLWYWMFGIEYGDLEIRLITQAGTDDRLTKANDDLGDYNKWIQFVTHIPMCTENFQVVIDAEDKQQIPSEGGFAVDDLLWENCEYPLPVSPGACPIGQGQCNTGECYPSTQKCDYINDCCDGTDENKQSCLNDGYSMCDFEDGMCDWEQLTTDEFDWTRRQGSTPSSGTGPSRDHTFGTKDGWYVYTEGSNPRRNGDRAKLASFPIEGTITGCTLRYYYHMEGYGIGTLNVYTRTVINGPMTLLWSYDRAIGGEWVYNSIQLISQNDFQVIIEGVVGYTTDSDIGLDDITLTPGCVRSSSSLPTVTTPKIITLTPPRTISPCLGGRFYCKVNGECIDAEKRCDGAPDCPDGADELFCPCSPGMLPCYSGCIEESKYCDFTRDCQPTDDDEAQCPTECDFEVDFCYWSQDKTDDRDWKWFDYNDITNPNYKGPNTDHTTGQLSGHYIYVDGNVFFDNQRAKLISPMYKKSTRGCRFSLWYWMFGLEFGDLYIHLKTAAGEMELTQLRDDAPDYNKWQQHIVDIPECSTDFQVVIDAKYELPVKTECGFAIDDIMFDGCENPVPQAPGTCGQGYEQCSSGECYVATGKCDFGKDCCDSSDEGTPSCISQGYNMCDFEQGLCDWTQLSTDEFDWTRERGDTGSHGTGPDADHTLGTEYGWYIYTEASNPARFGDRARLASYPIRATLTGTCSLRFFYHMEGFGIGTLNIYTRTAVNGPLTLQWSIDKAVGGHWVFHSITLQNNQDFQVIIEGVIGISIEGDIGIDDVSLTPDCIQAADLPTMTTTPMSGSTRRTVGYCIPSKFFCQKDIKCIDDVQVCDGNDDCSDAQDEMACPSESNTALIIGLSVTFGIIFLVVIGGGVFYFCRKDSGKQADTTGMIGTSFSPGTYEQDNPSPVKMGPGGEVAFTMDRSDA